MKMFFGMLAWDSNVQMRHHIFTANVVSTAFICGFVMLLPASAMDVKLASFFIFADPALIGLSFIGAIVLMEKSMRVHLALGITPCPPWVYVISKAVVLTLSGTASGLAVAAAAYRGVFDWPAMTGALLLSNAVAVLIGFVAVARARSMNELLLRLLYISLFLFIPLLAHFEMVPAASDWLFAPIPSTSMLWLLDAAGGAPSATYEKTIFSVVYLTAWTVGALVWALRSYRTVLSDDR